MLTYNKAELLINGEEKFPRLFADLEQAEHFIHLEYYIVEEGIILDRLMDILKRKASEGVEVLSVSVFSLYDCQSRRK